MIRVNDFVVKFANVNGSGSASANTLFAKAIMRMGVPATGQWKQPRQDPTPRRAARPQAILRGDAGEASPNSLMTGSWQEAQARLELEGAGFRFVSNRRELPWQHFLIFERP